MKKGNEDREAEEKTKKKTEGRRFSVISSKTGFKVDAQKHDRERLSLALEKLGYTMLKI